MDWFGKTISGMDPGVAKALALARDWSLPFTARSLTHDERVDQRTSTIPLWLLGYGLFAILILLVVFGSGLGYGGVAGALVATVIAVPMLIGFGFVVQRMAHDWASRPGHRDPGISIEIGADGIVVSGADGVHPLPWREIKASIINADEEEETGFAGLAIECPLGRIELRDSGFNDGRTAAALIVRGMHDDHVRREREKVERFI